MRTILLSFLLLILFAITCSAEGFRSFVGRIRESRRLRPRRGESARSLYLEEEQEEELTEGDAGSPRESSRFLLQELWQDFSPFNFSFDESAAAEEEEYERDLEAKVVHFCFLVHGLNGFSKDLSYLQAVMRRNAREKIQQQRRSDKKRHSDVVIHAPVCNERKTVDGVEAGGERLTEEVCSVIREEMALREENSSRNQGELPVVTLSFLGNSLGGLYSRYAIAKIFEGCERDSKSGHLVMDGKYRLHLNIFCTTATPHLGIASHTYIPLPRVGELGLAQTMGQTGRDILRFNGLMRQMATSGHFLNPMKLFRQRIAYANAYGTDFPVPVHTAAFLHNESDYPHHFVDNKLERTIVEEHSDLCIATIYTPPQQHDYSELGDDSEDKTDELAIMSRSLDALGWKKVFVDPRKIVPKLSNPIPRVLGKAASIRLSLGSNGPGPSGSDADSSSSMALAGSSDSENGSQAENDYHDESSEHSSANLPEAAADGPTIDRLKARGVVSSREIFHAVGSPPQPREASHMFHWPLGHNMIVAMSRNSIYTYLNKSGRPIVDALAAELVDDIFAFSEGDDDDDDPAPTKH